MYRVNREFTSQQVTDKLYSFRGGYLMDRTQLHMSVSAINTQSSVLVQQFIVDNSLIRFLGVDLMDISMYNIIYSQDLGVVLYNYMYWV